MRTLVLSLLACLPAVLSLNGCGDAGDPAPVAAQQRPNILLIVVDDMGFADLGSFGSEIPTPNLDALAYAGVRLSNFISSPACSPTRAMLLTGVDAHKAGFGNLKEELAPNQRGRPGFEGYLPEHVVTVASLLRDSGYSTYMTGKWHLGVEDVANPPRRGFEKSFAMMLNASHFGDMRPAYHPDPDAKAEYREDGVVLDALPAEFEYSSQYYVDKMIEYLGDTADAPFFAYLAFSAPHWPLQAPDAALAQFRGEYDVGYDAVLERRLAAQKALGLIPGNARPSGRAPKGRRWDELTEAERRVEARGMEVYAAMVAEIDRHTGRLVEHLRESGQLDDTVIIFLSDNGAEGHDYDDTWPADAFPAIRKAIDERHDFSYENMGRLNSYTLYGPNWARVSAPAFRLYKAFPTEGGVRTAAFVHFPGRFESQVIMNDLVLAKDIAPTVLELAGLEHPGNEYRGRMIETMTGQSAVALFEGRTSTRLTAARTHADELIGKRGIRQGDWKLVHMPPPYGNGDWQLYNLAEDLAEADDLAAEMPDKVAELAARWEQYADENGIILPDWVSGY